jgi:hypothetical protein
MENLAVGSIFIFNFSRKNLLARLLSLRRSDSRRKLKGGEQRLEMGFVAVIRRHYYIFEGTLRLPFTR